MAKLSAQGYPLAQTQADLTLHQELFLMFSSLIEQGQDIPQEKPEPGTNLRDRLKDRISREGRGS